eukprot:12540348-Alexandrium_andersonii.AAC.1
MESDVSLPPLSPSFLAGAAEVDIVAKLQELDGMHKEYGQDIVYAVGFIHCDTAAARLRVL